MGHKETYGVPINQLFDSYKMTVKPRDIGAWQGVFWAMAVNVLTSEKPPASCKRLLVSHMLCGPGL